MKILLTGANGFIGARLAEYLSENSQHNLTCAVRRQTLAVNGRLFLFNGLTRDTDWAGGLVGQEVVVHVAARAHIMKDEVSDPLSEYRKINVEGTMNLARQAAQAGVRRFVFLSSIKVNGEGTLPGSYYTADDSPAPEDAYGVSKMEAEQELWEVSRRTGMEIVIIRPPLVYGPGVKGNFASLMKLVEKGFPLPLGAVHNERSLVALDNLVDLVALCIEHPAAANEVFLASDGQDLSTTDLIRRVARAMGKSARLIAVPSSMLMFGASMLRKRTLAQRLLGSLQVDISKTKNLLGWTPLLSVDEGLERCCLTNRNI